MKKVLLTSAVVLATFGATQAVSASAVDFKAVLAKIDESHLTKEAKDLANKLYGIQQNELQSKGPLAMAYKKYVDAENVYKSLSERVKAAYTTLENLKQEKLKMQDSLGDRLQLVDKLAEFDKAIADAQTTASELKTKIIPAVEAELATATATKEKAQKAKTDAEISYTAAKQSAANAGVAFDESKPEFATFKKELDKTTEDLKNAEKNVLELQERLEKRKAELKEAELNEALYQAGKSAAIATIDGDAAAAKEAFYGLDKKIQDAENEVALLQVQIKNGRRNRDVAQAALEKEEKRVSKIFKENGLTYSRTVFETAIANTVNTKVGWYKNTADKWTYITNVYGATATGWKQVNGTWYYFNTAGEMQTGWQSVGGTWYYLNGSGELVTGWLQDGGKWYFLDASGAMKANQWIQNNGSWYYLNGSGAMKASGWFQVGDKWYYATESGAIAVNTTVGGYTVNGNGEWVK